jgi:ElaB/YqjD/DUF883 family membrane-anchored ribosome-binding protein
MSRSGVVGGLQPAERHAGLKARDRVGESSHNNKGEHGMEKQFIPDVGTTAAHQKNPAVRMVEQVSDRVVRAKEAVVDFGRQTVEGLDAQRRPVAATLDNAASTLHQQTDRVADAAHGAADRVQATADYVRGNGVSAMVKDVGNLVRRHPGKALIVAAVAGFAVAQVIRPKN